jgi:hypothetical protein
MTPMETVAARRAEKDAKKINKPKIDFRVSGIRFTPFQFSKQKLPLI